MAYYIDVFSPQTYLEYCDSKQDSSGTKRSNLNRFKKLHPGDKLLCYVTEFSRWVGVLEVTGSFFEDCSKEPYALQVPVVSKVWLPLKKGLPMREDGVINLLSFSKDGLIWNYKVQNTLNEIDTIDGELLEKMLKKQSESVESSRYIFSKNELKKIQKLLYSSTLDDIENVELNLDDFVDFGEKDIREQLSCLNKKMQNISAEKIKKIVSLTLRKDSVLVNALKSASKYKCQFPGCQSEIRMKGGGVYVEVAHITPLNNEGKSILGNLLVLCPNHHKEFDYGELNIVERSPSKIRGILNEKEFEIEVFNAD